MLDPWKEAELDQAKAELAEILPSLWWSMFSSLLKQGFKRDEAMELTKLFVEMQMFDIQGSSQPDRGEED